MSELAILGGPKTRKEPYPNWPVWDQREVDAVVEVVKSGRWGGYPYPGPKTAELARKFAELQGGGYAVPMINGTVTMEVALRAAGIGWGDEVIVPAYTFQATASAPMSAGAIPSLWMWSRTRIVSIRARLRGPLHRRPGPSSRCISDRTWRIWMPSWLWRKNII